MAQEFLLDDGTDLVIPGAYPAYQVKQGASGNATTGILFLVGEASQGPDWTLEADLSANVFGPNQLAKVQAKYGAGPLVDAFTGAINASNDAQVTGAVNGVYLVKTNVSGKAFGALPKIGGGTYANLFDRSYGLNGNLYYFTTSAKAAEVKPTTGAFTFIPAVGTVNASLRVNGAAIVSLALAAADTPATLVSDVAGLTGMAATGGALRTVLPGVSGNIAVAATGNQIVVSYTGTFTTTPTAGDTLMVPAGSAVAGAGNANVGAYVVTAATSASITATKLSDAAKPGGVPGVITAPVNVASTAVLATTDVKVYAPVTITLASSTVIDGVGKSLEINELTTGTDLLSRTAYVLGTTTPVSWVSKQSAPALLVSASEYQVELDVNRQLDSFQAQIAAGGRVALQLGYTGTTCAVTVSATSITLVCTGGVSSGQTFVLPLAQYPTIADLVNYIGGALPGFTAAAGSAAIGQLSPLRLDEGTFSAGTTWGNKTLRLKVDATDFYAAVQQGQGAVQLGNPAAPAAAGLPDVLATPTYLASGSRGGTSDAQVNAAVAALAKLKGNFVVPLFSQDATADIALGATDSTSAYTIANVIAQVNRHIQAMSTRKKRRHRQAFVSFRGSYAAAKNQAANLATGRCVLAFQDMVDAGASGVVQFQPWYNAAKAAGFQAAAFRKAIFGKLVQCSGFIQAAGDFDPTDDDQVEDALRAGLLVGRKADPAGFEYVSDQTTYLRDNNFVFNSIQAVYMADFVALSVATRMEKAFKGQNFEDVAPGIALTTFDQIMGDMLALKATAKSSDAPKGYKNALITVSAPEISVKAEIKLDTAVYFIPIDFLVSQVTGSASG